MFLVFTLCLLAVGTSRVLSQRFAHISDIHYDSLYVVGSSSNCTSFQTTGCCRSLELPLEPTHPASPMGEYTCDSPIKLLQVAVEFITQLKPDFLVFTGDSVDHHSFGDNWKHNMDEIRTVALMLAGVSPRVYAVLGNHDTYPIDQLYSVNCSYAPCFNTVLNDIADIWCPVYNWTDDMCATFRNGGYYADDQVIVLNSLWWDVHNIDPGLMGPLGPLATMVTWFLDQLSNNPDRFILAHMPPGASEVSPEFTELMTNVSNKYNLTKQLYGHSHMDTFRFVGGQPVFIMPSLVPSQHFPAIRLWTWSGDDVSYDQYAFNLTVGPSFKRQYSSSDYGIDTFSGKGWSWFYSQLLYNVTAMNMFIDNYYFGSGFNCDDACRSGILNDIKAT